VSEGISANQPVLKWYLSFHCGDFDFLTPEFRPFSKKNEIEEKNPTNNIRVFCMKSRKLGINDGLLQFGQEQLLR
jgi:hypothetical protein